MSKLLIKFSSNWADEIDVNGSFIMSADDWMIEKSNMKKIEYPIEYYVGSNEEIVFDSYDDLISCYTEFEISEDDVKVLERLEFDGEGETGPEVEDYEITEGEEYDVDGHYNARMNERKEYWDKVRAFNKMEKNEN